MTLTEAIIASGYPLTLAQAIELQRLNAPAPGPWKGEPHPYGGDFWLRDRTRGSWSNVHWVLHSDGAVSVFWSGHAEIGGRIRKILSRERER